MQTPAPVCSKLFFIAPEQRPPGFAVLLGALEKNSDFEIKVIGSHALIPPEVLESGRGVIVYVISQKHDLLELLKFDFLRRPGRAERFKCLAWNGLPHPSIPELLRTQGCDDVLGYETPIKSVGHKIQTALKRVLLKKVATSSRKNATASLDGSAKKNSEGVQVETLPPMPADVLDCWFLKRSSDCRFIMGRWLIEMHGPGPADGEWTKVASAKNGGDVSVSSEVWEWRSRKADSPFFEPQSVWRFHGREPEFVWKTLKWRFVGTQALLELRRGGETAGFRFKATSARSVLEMRENSARAQAFMPLIEQSLQCEVLLKQDRSQESPNFIDLSIKKNARPSTDATFDRERSPDWKKRDSVNELPKPIRDARGDDAASQRRMMLEKGIEAYTRRGVRFQLEDREVDVIGMDHQGIHLIAPTDQFPIEQAKRLLLSSNHSDQAAVEERLFEVAYVSSDAYMEGSAIATFSAQGESKLLLEAFSRDLAEREKRWFEFLNAVQGRAAFRDEPVSDRAVQSWAPFKVLVLGERSSHRESLKNILLQLQFKSEQIRSTGNLEKAVYWLGEEKIDLIFLFESAQMSRYWLSAIRQTCPKALVFWICSMTSQARLGQVAELGANGILMQPLEPLRVVGLISWVASHGLPLAPYEQLLHEAREWMRLGQKNRAIECLERAITMESRPSQAFQELADLAFASGDWESARNHLKRAISGNALHLPSLLRLAELERNQGNWAESYNWYLRALQVFPEGADRMTHAFSLAVKTGSYQDLSLLDEYAERTHEMCDELHRHRCAALAVAGKFFLLEDGIETGIAYLRKAASLSGEFTAPIRYAIETLILFDEIREAGRFFEYFSERALDSIDYLYARAVWLEAQDQLDGEYEEIIQKLEARGVQLAKVGQVS